jgi:hypothetical protein
MSSGFSGTLGEVYPLRAFSTISYGDGPTLSNSSLPSNVYLAFLEILSFLKVNRFPLEI